MVTHVEATSSPKLRTRAYAYAVLTMLIVLGLDQLTKHTIATGIAAGDTQKFLPGINFVHVRNSGVAFGFSRAAGRSCSCSRCSRSPCCSATS